MGTEVYSRFGGFLTEAMFHVFCFAALKGLVIRVSDIISCRSIETQICTITMSVLFLQSGYPITGISAAMEIPEKLGSVGGPHSSAIGPKAFAISKGPSTICG